MREAARVMRRACRVVEETRKTLERYQGMTALDWTCDLVGERLGVSRAPGESTEVYRTRLIATGEVLEIQPGRVVMAGKVKMVTIEMGFTVPSDAGGAS